MDPEFVNIVEGLKAKCDALLAMDPVKLHRLPPAALGGGIYLFSLNGEHLYVGRTKRSLKTRLHEHVGTADDCPFAWRLARHATGNIRASYRRKGSRKDLLSQPAFKRAYETAKTQIREMDVRYVEESDPTRQALLEIYVSVVTKARHNDFDTH